MTYELPPRAQNKRLNEHTLANKQKTTIPDTIERLAHWARIDKSNNADDITLQKEENSNLTIRIEGLISPSFA